MTAQIGFERAGAQLRIARAELLLDLALKIDEAQWPDLLAFAVRIRDTTSAGSLAAFISEQTDALRAAEAELGRLRPRGG